MTQHSLVPLPKLLARKVVITTIVMAWVLSTWIGQRLVFILEPYLSPGQCWLLGFCIASVTMICAIYSGAPKSSQKAQAQCRSRRLDQTIPTVKLPRKQSHRQHARNSSPVSRLKPAANCKRTPDNPRPTTTQAAVRTSMPANPAHRVYHKEFQAINRFFKQFRLGFRLGDPYHHVVLTPSTVVYLLSKAQGVSIRSLQSNLTDLEELLYSQRARLGYPNKLSILFHQQPLALILPRVDPKPLRWTARQWQPQTWHTLLGRQYVADQGFPVTLNLESPQQFSILIGGQSGCGKSTLIDGLILNACMAASPRELEVVIIDIGQKHFGQFQKLPHCRTFMTTLKGALAVLQQVENALVGPENQYQARTLVVIDEIQRLTRCDDSRTATEFKRLLANIAAMGRAYGYSLVLGTQKPMASVVPTLIRDNCVVRIAGMCQSNAQSAAILGDSNYAAAALGSIGSFILSDGHNNMLFYSYLIDDVTVEIAQLQCQYPDAAPATVDADIVEPNVMTESTTTVLSTEYGVVRAGTGQREADMRQTIPQPVLEVFTARDNGDGTLRNGWLTNAINAYAEHVGKSPNGNNFQRFRTIVEEMQETYLRTYSPLESDSEDKRIIKLSVAAGK